jgi:hypothetical protein
MSRQLFCAGVLGVLTLSTLVSGCSNASDPSTDAGATGTVELPLTAQSAGVQYRLAKARFTILNTDSSATRVITPAADLPVDQEVLPAGNYVITLSDGWVLQAKGPEDSGFSSVDAELVQNDLPFTIVKGQTIDVVFEFVSRGTSIKLKKGRVNVRISVSDCSAFDSYAATLAGHVVDCLGRIDQNSFMLNDSGYLVRNFAECTQDQIQGDGDEPLIDAIDGLLGLQYSTRDPLPDGTNPLAYGQDCIAGRWAEWREQFDASGTTECPDWKLSGIINEPDAAVYQKLAGALPQLPAADTGRPPGVLNSLKIDAAYALSFATPAGTDQQCGSAGSCATLCAGGFPSFVIASDQGSVTTDPVPWESNRNYNPDPFLPSYYHPMSYYGPLPGDLFGAAIRANQKEPCSFYDDKAAMHVAGTLQPNCTTTPDGIQACVSVCVPTPVIQ